MTFLRQRAVRAYARQTRKEPGLAQRVAQLVGTAKTPARKSASVFRSPAHLRTVASLPCVACGLEKHSQAAHLNGLWTGKARGLKASDALVIPLCAPRLGIKGCHALLDSAGVYDKPTSAALQLAWLQATRDQLKRLGQWPEAAEADVVRLVSAYLGRQP